MNKRITVRIAVGVVAGALLGIAGLAAPAQAGDSAWGRVAPKDDTAKHRIIGAPSYRIIGSPSHRIIG